MTAQPEREPNESPPVRGYAPRPTRCTGVSEIAGWTLKRYEISAHPDGVPAVAGSAVDAVLTKVLGDIEPADLGLGFVVLHRGTEGLWLLIDLWQGDIICQHGFRAPLADPTAFEPIEPGGPTVCVWEMEVFIHERQAFITSILDGPEPDPAAYLADRLHTTAQSNRSLVERFNAAWANGDVDALMTLMADDPVYRASTGPEPGRTFSGTEPVRAGFAAVIAAEAASGEPAAPPGELHVFADHALSFWAYPATHTPGGTVVVEGVDVWTFTDGRIAAKDAYRKAFVDPQPDPQ